MSDRSLILVLLLFCGFSFSSCSQVSNTNNNLKADSVSLHLPVDTARIAVLKFNQKTNWPFEKNYKSTNLTKEEFIKIDSLMMRCIKNYNNGLPHNEKKQYHIVDLKKWNYKRQYIPVINLKGEKEVWINCFCYVSDFDWKKDILSMNDGGNCFFNLKVNLTTKQCLDLVVNGYA